MKAGIADWLAIEIFLHWLVGIEIEPGHASGRRLASFARYEFTYLIAGQVSCPG